jgi:cytosine/uracil/thiamine/allantoin permease
MITEYWIIRRGHYRVKDLYSLDRKGWYWYTYGVNFRLVHLVFLIGRHPLFSTRAGHTRHTLREFSSTLLGLLGLVSICSSVFIL